MGRIVKQVSEHTTRYYWYPGERAEWIRAVVAVGLGLLAFAAVGFAFRQLLAAVVAGTSVTAAVAGVNLGRRDARALAVFAPSGDRLAAVAATGRAAWRGAVEGIGGAGIAILVVNLPATGIAANWLLPLVPPTIGALAHQGGMLYERLGTSTVASRDLLTAKSPMLSAAAD
jgi:hypothetical protein